MISFLSLDAFEVKMHRTDEVNTYSKQLLFTFNQIPDIMNKYSSVWETPKTKINKYKEHPRNSTYNQAHPYIHR